MVIDGAFDVSDLKSFSSRIYSMQHKRPLYALNSSKAPSPSVLFSNKGQIESAADVSSLICVKRALWSLRLSSDFSLIE